MVSLRRRHLLRGAVGLAAGLAGCNGLDSLRGSERTPTPPAGGSGSPLSRRSTTSPDTAHVRVADGRPPVWLPDDSDGDGSRPTPDDRARHLSSIVVDSRSRAERVAFVDDPAVDTARSFVAETSFDSETLYIQNHRVEDCFRLELCHLSWHDGTVETDYARHVRPYDERCAADEWIAESWLIRIPAALSEQDVTSRSTSVGSGPCERQAASGESGDAPSGTDVGGDR